MSQSKQTAAKTRKGNKRERTRAKLIEVASQLVKENGYERTTLDEVARRAGMTRGAIYGNFKNRDDLILAVVETRWRPIVPPFIPGAPFKQQMRILGEAVVAAIPERRTSAIGALSFQLYALRHEEMRQRLVAVNEEIYRWAAQQLVTLIAPEDLPMPPEDFVRVLHALTDGLLFLRFLTPELVPDEVIINAFVALA